MRTSTTILALLALATSCARDGSCRPPPDPEPADTVPVGGDDPDKPIEQPKPATTQPAKADPPPAETPPVK